MKLIDFSRVECVWLDLDDTLWDFERNSLDSLVELYSRHGLDRFFKTVESWCDRYHHHNRILWEQYNVAAITREYLQRERFLRPLIEAGCDCAEAELMIPVLHHDYLAILGGYDRLVPHARQLLERLRDAGYRIGVISNGFKEVQYRKLDSSRISHFIDCVVLSDEIDVNKPDRRLFDYAVEKAGVTAAGSLIIGDNASTDIAGGCNAGWQTIYFNRDGLKAPASVDTVEVGSLAEVIAML